MDFSCWTTVIVSLRLDLLRKTTPEAKTNCSYCAWIAGGQEDPKTVTSFVSSCQGEIFKLKVLSASYIWDPNL